MRFAGEALTPDGAKVWRREGEAACVTRVQAEALGDALGRQVRQAAGTRSTGIERASGLARSEPAPGQVGEVEGERDCERASNPRPGRSDQRGSQGELHANAGH